MRSKTLAEVEFTSPEHFNFPPESKKSALLRRTSVLRSKTLVEGEFTSPEHFNFLPESKKSALLRRTSVLRSKTLAEDEFTSPEHFNFSQESQKRGHNLRCDLFFGAGDEARSQCYHTATRTVGDKRPTGAFSRFARALFAPLPAGAKKSALLRRTSVLRSKTLAEGEFTSPEHFNFPPESKKEVTTYVVTSFLERATRLELATSTLARWRSTR